MGEEKSRGETRKRGATEEEAGKLEVYREE